MSISRRQRRRIFARDGLVCYWHDGPVRIGDPQAPASERATLDHVKPRSAGGSNRAGNIVTSCEECNANRADRLGPPPGISKPLPDPQELERRYRSLEPPPYPNGIYLEPRSSQYRAYRRWWNKRGYWQAAQESEAS